MNTPQRHLSLLVPCLLSTSIRVILRDISLVLMIVLISAPDVITVIVNGQRLGIKSVPVALNLNSFADGLGSTMHEIESSGTFQLSPLWFPLLVSKAALWVE